MGRQIRCSPFVPVVLLLLIIPVRFSVADVSATAGNHAVAQPGTTPLQQKKLLIHHQIPAYAPDRVLVKFHPGTAASEIGKAHRQSSGKKMKVIPGIGVHVMQVPKGSVENKIAIYQANPNVEYAEPDFYRTLILPDEGNDPEIDAGGIVPGREYFEEQWGLNNTGQQHTSIDSAGNPTQVSGASDADIDAPEGWDITTGDRAVKIAILDTGIDCDSVEHAGKCVEEISFVGDYSEYLDDPEDYVGHGTHVAGIAAVHTNNRIGVAGIGWNSSLGNLKTCFAYELDLLPPLGIYIVIVGVCPVSSSADAIIYAANHGYHAINMSYGSDLVDENGNPAGLSSPPNVETDAINYAWNQGVVLVAAAGNDGDPTRIYPAANENVIAVGATDHADNLASFSTGGSNYSVPGDHWVSLMAPGKDTLSTSPVADCIFIADTLGYPFDPQTDGCLSWKSGTSMASPHVAGAAALVWAHLFPGQSPQSCVSSSGVPCNVVVRSHLEHGADSAGVSTQNFLAWSENGRLNVHGALTVVDIDLDGLPNNIDDDDDNDGLTDSEESALGTDPLLADTDADGLSDSEEIVWGTDPLDPYTDADSFKDGMEALAGYDPLDGGDYPVWGDIDDNGVVDVADVLLATRTVLGVMTLNSAQRARGNVAPLVGGVPESSPDDDFTVADLLLITGKATGSINY